MDSSPEISAISKSRLQSLYSDISRQKLSNPAGYQSSIEWWRRVLSRVVSSGWQQLCPDKLVLHVNNNLIESLKCDVGKPLGLASVIIELSSLGHLIPLTRFMTSKESVYYPGWLPYRIASYAAKPLWWSLKQLNLVDDSEISLTESTRWSNAKGQYVFLTLLEEAAEAVLQHCRTRIGLSLSDSLFTPQTFFVEFSKVALPNVTLSETDVKVLVKFLERDKGAIVCGEDIIKFVDEGTDGARQITPVDRGALELKTAATKLADQIEELQRQIEDRAVKIKDNLRRSRREIALSYLRSQKLLEELLRKRVTSLETIQSSLMKVETVAGDIEIIKAYETSTATLKAILAHPSLQRDHVDATMDALADAMADHAEIEEALRMGGETASAARGAPDIDASELEDELNTLVLEARRESAQKEALERLERAKETATTGAKISADERMSVDPAWEARWQTAQLDKAVQSAKDKDEEIKRRSKWEAEDAAKAAIPSE